MVQQLDCHLDVCRLASNDNQSLPFPSTCRRGGSVHPYSDCTRLHYLDLTCTHVANLVDLATSLSNDTAYKVVRDINLLGLKLLGRVMLRRRRPRGPVRVRVPWYIRRSPVRWAAGITGWAVSRVRGRWHSFLCFNEDVSNVVCSNVDSIGNSSYTEYTLSINVR